MSDDINPRFVTPPVASKNARRHTEIFQVEDPSDDRLQISVYAYTDGPDWTEKPFISIKAGQYPVNLSVSMDTDDARRLIALLQEAVAFAESSDVEAVPA